MFFSCLDSMPTWCDVEVENMFGDLLVWGSGGGSACRDGINKNAQLYILISFLSTKVIIYGCHLE